MSRQRTYSTSLATYFDPLEWGLLHYYAWKYEQGHSPILRSILMQFVDADADFDAKEFGTFLKKHLKKRVKHGEDEETVKAIQRLGTEWAEEK